MRVYVDEDICQGHTLCNLAAPDVFELRIEDGHSMARISEVPPELEESARKAQAGCPERAIVIEE